MKWGFWRADIDVDMRVDIDVDIDIDMRVAIAVLWRVPRREVELCVF